jgi:hypothetical protein
MDLQARGPACKDIDRCLGKHAASPLAARWLAQGSLARTRRRRGRASTHFADHCRMNLEWDVGPEDAEEVPLQARIVCPALTPAPHRCMRARV